MFRMSFRNLFARKLRLVTTALAIVLGVAFTTGTMILTDTMIESLDSAIAETNEGVDVVVRGLEVGEDEVFTLRAPVALDQLERIRAIDGVTAAEPYWVGYTQIIGSDGKALSMVQSAGLNWIDDPELTAFELASGQPPTDDGDVVLGTDAADEAQVSIGDEVDLSLPLRGETPLPSPDSRHSTASRAQPTRRSPSSRPTSPSSCWVTLASRTRSGSAATLSHPTSSLAASVSHSATPTS